ncbi:hypothetical protein [Saccharopolyspora gregorii]
MPAAVTAQQRADRTARALAAATAAGRDLGLDVGAATVLHDAFSVVVHLSPSPVVVRVPTVLPGGTDVETQAAASAASSTSWPGWPSRACPSSRRARSCPANRCGATASR